MEKVTIKGSDYLLPEEMCVSCSGSPAPNTHIIVTYATKSYKKKFEFPACEHCAELHRKFWRRSLWIILALMIIPLGGGIALFISGVLSTFARSLGLPAEIVIGVVFVFGLAGTFYLAAKYGEALALRSLGDPTPPLKVVRISSLVPEMSWTFHFENEYYASKFRSLNQDIVKNKKGSGIS